jgi:hypothetical protein
VLSVLAIVVPSSSSAPPLMEPTAPKSCTCATYRCHMKARSRTDSRYTCLALLKDTLQRAASTTALDGHVRHGVEGSACGRRTTQRIMHTMHLDGFGQLCSVLICMPRQMTFPYKLAINSIVRSKRNHAPISVLLGFPGRSMLSHSNIRDVV